MSNKLTSVELLKRSIDEEIKLGTKIVVNWDMYLAMEKEQIENAVNQHYVIPSNYYHKTYHSVDTNEMVDVPQQKENTYTEEQVIGFSKWADDFGYMYNSSANCWYTQDGYKRTDEETIYQYKQSLK